MAKGAERVKIVKAINPIVSKHCYASGNPYWMVSCMVDGKRYRKKHGSQDVANRDRTRLIRQGAEGLSHEQYCEAQRALHRLGVSKNEDARGRGLEFAVEWFCQHFIDEKRVKPMREYFDEFVAIKRAQGRRSETVTQIERLMGRFVNDYEQANVTLIKYEEIESWVASRSRSPKAYRHNYYMLKHFFGYLSGCSEKTPNHAPILDKSPFEGRAVIFQDDEAEECARNVIFTAKECEKLIAEAAKYNAQRMFVWLIFTGMRPIESVRFWTDKRWGWKLVSEDLKYITVPKAVSKTRQNRVIYVNDTLRAWLLAYRNHASLMTRNWRYKYSWVRKNVLPDAKLVADVARHTVISMMIKKGCGWAEIELQMGNKKDVQMRHYASLIGSECEVRDFYALTPERFEHDLLESELRIRAKENRKRAILENRLKSPGFQKGHKGFKRRVA